MHKKKLLALLLLFSTTVYSQELKTDTLKPHYEFSFDLGFYHSLYGDYNDYYYVNQVTDSYIVTSMLFCNGIRFPNRLYLGVATGSEFFHTQTIPILAEVKYDFLRSSLSPFIYGRVGGGVALNLGEDNDNSYKESWQGGFIGTWGLGVKKNFKNKTALSFSLGYRHQKLSRILDYSSGSLEYQETDYSINRVVVRTCFYFK